MPQDAFTIGFVAKELDRTLTGGKVSKIVQPDRDNLSFIIYTANGSLKLDICLSARACRISLSQRELFTPQAAPGFCMLLRKHLQGAAVTAVRQLEGERVVCMDFDCFSEFERQKMTLYAEIMGKYSNAILTCGGVILGALKTTAIGENTKRVLFPGVKYQPPAPQDKIAADDIRGIEKILEEPHGDIAHLISSRIKGVAISTAADIAEAYENPTARDIADYLGGKVYMPCVVFEGGKPADFCIRSCSPDKKLYPTLLEAQAAYYDECEKKREFDDAKKKLEGALSAALKKCEKRLAAVRQKLLECRDADTVKLKGELITANIYAVQRGMTSFEAVNYYDENCGKIKIELDGRLTPAQNAQKYYKKYAKLKRTRTAAEQQETEETRKEDYLNSIAAHISLAESQNDLAGIAEELEKEGLFKPLGPKEKKKREIPFRTFGYGGYKIYAGRNNIQNDRLLKSSPPEDIWLHTQGYHSSHVVIACGGQTPPDDVLLFAAEICAYYSSARGGTKVPVDYTRRKHVKKPPAARAGFVTYTDYKTILVKPDNHGGEL